MAKHNPIIGLKEQIKELEAKKAEQGKILKEAFYSTYESLKPINLLKDTAKSFASSSELKETVIETSAIIAAGLISKKMVESSNNSPVMRLLGSLLQLVTTNLISKYGGQLHEIVTGIIEKLTTSKE